MRVLILVSLVGYASAACTAVTTAAWSATGGASGQSGTATTTKCIHREWCAVAACTGVAKVAGVTTVTTSGTCGTYGTCAPIVNVCKADGTLVTPPAFEAVTGAAFIADNTKANCDLIKYTPLAGTAAGTTEVTGGTFTAFTWTSAGSWFKKDPYVVGDIATGTGTALEWDAIKTAGATGLCPCWDSLTAKTAAAGTWTDTKDCVGDLGHGQRRYCSSTAGGTTALYMPLVQITKAVAPATSPVTYTAKTGATSLVIDGASNPKWATCNGTAAPAAWTLHATDIKGALNWKTGWTISGTGACTAPAAGSTSPAAAFSGIAAIFLAIMAML